MKYLSYQRDGLFRNFCIRRPIVRVGRGSENDLVLDEEFVSRSHLTIEEHGDHVILRDLGSMNGTVVNGVRVEEAELRMGESFSIKTMEFTLREGEAEQFDVVSQPKQISTRLAGADDRDLGTVKTKDASDAYSDVLRRLMQAGVDGAQLNEVFGLLSVLLPTIPDLGSVYVLTSSGDELSVVSAQKGRSESREVLSEIEKLGPLVANCSELRLFCEARGFACFPVKLKDKAGALIHVPAQRGGENRELLDRFLQLLAMEIEVLSRVPSGPSEDQTIRLGEPEDEIVTQNPEMLSLCQQARKIALSDIPVLIRGESGTGKELLARLIHRSSKRASRPFVAINCAAIPETLLESELFGHEKGAFTGAHRSKHGKLEMASGGTLVLDEIGDMPLMLQAKLLRAIESHEFFRLGGVSPTKVDLRIISITNSDLARLINERRFREDLYYRLAQHEMVVPPLRQRREDISVLIDYFVGQFCKSEKKTIGGFSRAAHEALQSHAWPGNVRQLKNEIYRLVTLTADAEVIGHGMLSEHIRRERKEHPVAATAGISTDDERERILGLLDKNNWNKSKTAREMGITFQGLWWKMKKLGIRGPDADHS
ncbi:MAG: sigma 54-interacting transcriptional regulator [Acidobacteriota bacterium]